jgi:hypothetical protein
LLVSGEPLGQTAQFVPPTRLDPAEVAIQERPIGEALTTSYERELDDEDIEAAPSSPDAVADARVQKAADAAGVTDARLVPPSGAQPIEPGAGVATRIAPLGLALMSLGLLLVLGGGVAGWRRQELRSVVIPAVGNWSGWRSWMTRSVALPNWRPFVPAWRPRLPRLPRISRVSRATRVSPRPPQARRVSKTK